MPQLSSGEIFSTQRHREQLLYFMLKPSHALAIEIDRQRRVLGLDTRYPLERFHITLQPFGDIRAISAADLDQIRLAAASLREEPFSVILNKLSGNALVGTNARALRDFQRTLIIRLAARGVLFFDYEFNPHVSLAYSDWQPRNIPISPIAWQVDELLLINSIHGQGHQVIDRWPLIERQGTFPF